MTPENIRAYQEYRAANNIGSVYDLLRVQASVFADNELITVPQQVAGQWGLSESSLSYRFMLGMVDQLSSRYRLAGYTAGHRVALLLENRPAHFIHWLALNALGASVVPINPDYTDDETTYLLSHSDSALLVCLRSRLGQVAGLAQSLGVPIWCDGDETAPPGPNTMPGQAVDAAVAVASKRECALMYTSGTTGRPKGCMLSNDYFHGWAQWYGAQRGLIELRPGKERLLTPLPTFHINAMGNSFMGMLASGGTQIIVDRFHPSTWLQMAAETKATCFHYLGVMPAILLEIAPGPADRAHVMRFGMGGGVHPDHHARFENRFGVPLLEGWAMTETGGAGIVCASNEPRHVGSRCIGSPDRPGPALEIRLADDLGNDVEPGVPGELLLRAAGSNRRERFFSGYLKDPEATDAIWADDWLHTGDIMVRLADGNLRFVDRKKNIVRRSGENIAAMEVESAIASHPLVKAVAVIAVLDPLREEEVFAAIVPRDPSLKNERIAREIFDHCAGLIAYFKLPGYIAFLDALPTTSTQKVRKADLGAMVQDPENHPDTIDLRPTKQALRPRSRNA